MRYDDRVIDEVQSAINIVDVISQYVALKRSGRHFKACCPFHQEKTPSFMVQPEKQIFRCFGCGVGGDVFAFLMRYENSSFPEVLRQLAERANIHLPEDTQQKKEGPSQSERLYEVYRLAAEFYQKYFKHPSPGKEARTYFEKRGFSLSLAEEMGVGWAPREWRLLFEFLSKKGFGNDFLLESRLVQKSPKGNFYDTFRGRLIFPIHNLQGKVVAFGGRLIAEEEGPKYLNSPENPIFYKRKELYGLHLAKKYVDREQPRILVVEGYLDFLRLYEKGFKAAVATLGTSLTDDHVQLLKRFADEAIVIYDGDKAGEAASMRGLEIFLEGGMSVKIVRLPTGFDPDDFLQKKGVEAFQALLDSAMDLFDYKLEVLLKRFNRWDSLGLVKITNDFLETFVKVKNPILLDRYIKRLASSLGIEEQSLRLELAKLQKKEEARGKLASSASPEPIAKATPTELISDEALLLGVVVDEPSLREEALHILESWDTDVPWVKNVFPKIIELLKSKNPFSWPQVLTRVEDDRAKQQLLNLSSMEWSSEDRKKALEDSVRSHKRKKTKLKLEELRRSIAKAEKDGNQELMGSFVKEYQDLLRQT